MMVPWPLIVKQWSTEKRSDDDDDDEDDTLSRLVGTKVAERRASMSKSTLMRSLLAPAASVSDNFSSSR